jgi:geranyl-CoA carboxylase alpha subunit
MAAFDTLLIANRGEIACRVARTARRLGLRTVAVYSDPDRDARHVRLADRAVGIGGAAAAESYLDVEKILRAARISGAGAIHPGYGFLSENDAFARAVERAGLVFVGPPAGAIELMGSKRAAKERMIAAGVPCIPGYQGADQSDAVLLEEARKIGPPIMIKASSGGGGKGLRLVDDLSRIPDQLRLARAEAESAFGDGDLILERAIASPRHVEIQVFADRHGNVIHLGERDCSVQRRHQKIVEESPSPAVTPAIRDAMGRAAVAAAASIGYAGAGTIEFLLDRDGRFYFMEMNTRLQVEHPVTEMLTGLDLVEWQLDVARDRPLPIGQHDVRFDGHAIEVRLYAENAEAGFLPETGVIERLAFPDDVRVDHGLLEGTVVGAHYDPMLAKVIAHGRDRDEARRRLILALERTAVHGVVTNQGFLVDVLSCDAFARGDVATSFLRDHLPRGRGVDPRASMIAAVAMTRAKASDFWRSSGPSISPIRVRRGEETVEHRVESSDGIRFRVGEHPIEARGPDRFAIDGLDETVFTTATASRAHVTIRGRTATFDRAPASDAIVAGVGDGTTVAPMAGKIVDVRVEPGQAAARGQILVILEAMKMQLELTAAIDGVVDSVTVAKGQQVETRQVLVQMKRHPPSSTKSSTT